MNTKKTLLVAIMAVVLVCTCLVVFTACSPASDPDKAVSALKDNDYTAGIDSTIIPTALRLLGVKNVDSVVSGTKVTDDKTDTITIVYFSTKDAANDAWDTMQKYAEDEKDDNEDSDWVCKKSGKMIYFGTKAGVKAAR